MRKFLLATAIAVVAATNAQAAETTGTVRSVNTRSDPVTLSDGATYSLPEGIELARRSGLDLLQVTIGIEPLL